jgi:nitroreductase
MSTPAFPASQLLDALKWRYSSRAFDPQRQIPAATWAALEDSVVLAPSSFGLQPFRLLVIRDPALRERLLPHAWGQRQVVDASHFVVFAARTSVTEADVDRFVRLNAAVRGIAVESLSGFRAMLTETLVTDGFQSLAPHWAAHQAYLALGSLLTGAALLGVDACPMEGFVPAEFDRILGLPEQGLAAVVSCALGYRAADDPYALRPKVRFPKAELVKTL